MKKLAIDTFKCCEVLITCRSLPCFHTTCQKCLRRSFAETSLACPVCGKVHPAPEGVEKFPQNRYIITYMKINDKVFSKCKQHNDRKLSLFCKTAGCRKPICELCLIKEHMGHEVVDIAEEQKKKEAIKAIANELTSELAVARENLLEAKIHLEEDNATALAMLKERKTETIKLYDNMMKSVADQINISNEEVDKEISSIDSDLKLINDIIKGETRDKTSEGLSPDELEEIQQIKERIQGFLSQEKTFKYYKRNDEERAPENPKMRLKPEKIVVNLSDARNSNVGDKSDGIRSAVTRCSSLSSSDKRNDSESTRIKNSTSSFASSSSDDESDEEFASSCDKRNEVRLTGT